MKKPSIPLGLVFSQSGPYAMMAGEMLKSALMAIDEINQGDEFVRLSGVVRRADISTDNTVTSDKVADAHISYSGRGVIDSANRVGWLARFFNSAFAPY